VGLFAMNQPALVRFYRDVVGLRVIEGGNDCCVFGAGGGALVLGVRDGDALLPEAVERLRPDVIVVRSDAAVRDVLDHIAVATQHARKPSARPNASA
jgi:hypothetical protein